MAREKNALYCKRTFLLFHWFFLSFLHSFSPPIITITNPTSFFIPLSLLYSFSLLLAEGNNYLHFIIIHYVSFQAKRKAGLPLGKRLSCESLRFPDFYTLIIIILSSKTLQSVRKKAKSAGDAATAISFSARA